MSGTHYIKLSDLTKKIKKVFSETFGEQTYWIVAEISGHKFYPDKDRHYFDLVEKIENSSTEAAKVKANCWEQGSRQISHFENTTGQKFADGLQVLIAVRVNYHIVHGLSLTLTDIDPSFTLGNIERQRRETLARLVQENPSFIQLADDQYITRNKQIKLNCVIQRIALIGSPKSEGYTDFVHTISTNSLHYKFSIDYFYSAVQGINAELELVKTLIQVYETHKNKPYDCVVITRGGGARTDFLVFDTYPLARAVAKFPIPIITGIGHHKDVSLVDLMVHTQTKTPTKAAEFILAHNRSFEDNILRFQQRLVIKTQQLLANRTRRINAVQSTLTQTLPLFLSTKREALGRAKQIIQHTPARSLIQKGHTLFKLQQAVINCSTDAVYKHERKLNTLFHRLCAKPKEAVAHRNADLAAAAKMVRIYSNIFITHQAQYLLNQRSIMKMMSPQNILKKGFAIVSQNEKIVTRAEQISIGSSITLTLDQTDIRSTVTSKSESHGKYDI